MKRRSISLSDRHEAILAELSAKIGVTFVNTIERALEALEVAEARRDKEVAS